MRILFLAPMIALLFSTAPAQAGVAGNENPACFVDFDFHSKIYETLYTEPAYEWGSDDYETVLSDLHGLDYCDGSQLSNDMLKALEDDGFFSIEFQISDAIYKRWSASFFASGNALSANMRKHLGEIAYSVRETLPETSTDDSCNVAPNDYRVVFLEKFINPDSRLKSFQTLYIQIHGRRMCTPTNVEFVVRERYKRLNARESARLEALTVLSNGRPVTVTATNH